MVRLFLRSSTFANKTFRDASRQISHLLHGGATIIHSENGLYAVEKPVNVLSHPNRAGEGHKSIINGSYNSRKETFEINSAPGMTTEVVYLLNRLDSATSGIILLTTNESISKLVKNSFARREVAKVYKAIVFCDKDIKAYQKSLLWEDSLKVCKINGNNRAQQCVASSASAMHAITSVSITDPNLHSLGKNKSIGKDMMLLELRPKTGYTHQLRYQCALHDLPIVGDKTYGNFKLNRISESDAKSHLKKSSFVHAPNLAHDDCSITSQINSKPDFKRLFLHSFSVEFKYQFDQKTFHFKATSKLPIEFLKIIEHSYNP